MKITLRGGPMNGDQITISATLREAVLLDGEGNRVLYRSEPLGCRHPDGRRAKWFEWWAAPRPESPPPGCPHDLWPARWKMIKAAAWRTSSPVISIDWGPGIGVGGPGFGGPGFGGPVFGGPVFGESASQQIAAKVRELQRDVYRRRY